MKVNKNIRMIVIFALLILLLPISLYAQSKGQVSAAINGFTAENLLSTLISAYQSDPSALATKADVIIALYEVFKKQKGDIDAIKSSLTKIEDKMTTAGSTDVSGSNLSILIRNELSTDIVKEHLKKSLGINELSMKVENLSASGTVRTDETIVKSDKIAFMQSQIDSLKSDITQIKNRPNIVITDEIQKTKQELENKIMELDKKIENSQGKINKERKKTALWVYGSSAVVVAASFLVGAR